MTVYHGSGGARNIADVEGLPEALEGTAGAADLAALQTDLNGLGIDGVAGLQAALDAKQATLTGTGDVPGLQGTLDGKAAKLTIHEEYDTAIRTFGTGVAWGKVWTKRRYPGRTKLFIWYSVPMRNDSTGWGGGYTIIHARVENGSWVEIGNSGYYTVMGWGGGQIARDTNFFVYDPNRNSDYDFQVAFKHRAWDGTLTLNDKYHTIKHSRMHSKLTVFEVPK